MRANRAKVYRGIIGKKPVAKQRNIIEYSMQGVTAACIMALSDLLGQMLAGRVTSFFTPVAMGAYGFATGVVCYTVYQTLDTSMQRKGLEGAAKVKAAVYKMVVDQFVWCPFSTLVFVLYTALIEPAPYTAGDVVRLYGKILLGGYKIWPIMQLVNFLCVPARFQIAFMGAVSLLWNVYVKIVRTREMEK